MKTIKKKVFFSLSLVFIFLFLILFTAIHYEITRSLLPVNSQMTQQTVDNKAREINAWFSERISEVATLADYSNRHHLSKNEFFQETKALENRQSDIYESIRLVSEDGTSYSWITPSFLITDRPYFKKIKNSSLDYTISNALHSKEAKQDIIIILYRLPRVTSDNIAYIAAAVNINKMQEMAEEIEIYDGLGTLVNQHDDGTQTINSTNQLLSFKSSLILLPEWQLVYQTTQKNLLKTGIHVQKIMIWLFFILAGTIFLFFLFQLDAFIKPIEALNNTMKRVGKGDQNVRSAINRNDEIGELSDEFNQMLQELYRFEEESITRNVRLLQEQVKPHFLYNTLNAVQWLAQTGELDKMEEMIEALSTYFRVGLNNGDTWSTLFNETEHLKSYLTIQNIRYEKNIELLVDYKDELNDLKLPNFILQPLVENAIYHGIRPLSTDKQRISLIAFHKINTTIIQIRNTGIMPSEEKIKNINYFFKQKETQKDLVGFGLYGVYTQLMYAFSNQIKMHFFVENNECVVQIILPKGDLQNELTHY